MLQLGVAFAKSQGDTTGRSSKCRSNGVVIKIDKFWYVDFGADEEPIGWRRGELQFVRRPGAESGRSRGPATSRTRPLEAEEESENESDDDEGDEAGVSSESDDGNDDFRRVGQPDHALRDNSFTGEWTRGDHYSVDERAKHGFDAQNGAKVSNMAEDWKEADLFTYAKHFLLMNFLKLMAKSMTDAGREKAASGQRKFDKWQVTVLLQWIGVWMYMLAFPQQASSRRSYFTKIGFGPQHDLQGILLQVRRGRKGLGKGCLRERGSRGGAAWAAVREGPGWLSGSAAL